MSAYYAVIGRIHGDDEDTCYTFLGLDRAGAVREFKARIREDRQVEDAVDEDGEDRIYINHVLSSKTTITEE